MLGANGTSRRDERDDRLMRLPGAAWAEYKAAMPEAFSSRAGWRASWQRGLDRVMPSVIGEALAVSDAWQPDGRGKYCGRCGASLGVDGNALVASHAGCGRCHREAIPWRDVTRLSAYGDPMSAWIRAMKFRNRFVWANWLGQRLGESMADHAWAGQRDVWVTAVPMPWRRRWWRGYNQAERMARALGEVGGWRYAELLKRTRHPPPQTQVAPSYRARNVSDSFVAEDVELAGSRIVLVDDVLTSGATLRGCVRALGQCGACDVAIAVAAVADPKRHDPGT